MKSHARSGSLLAPLSFESFGELLCFLRKRIHLSQRDLAAQVGYHYSHISRIENNLYVPDVATIRARFIPALQLNHQPEWGNRLIVLAAAGAFSPAQDSETAATEIVYFQLPVNLASFLGREVEISLLQQLSLDAKIRLITVVGPPGVGKTSLVVHVAGLCAREFKHGVVFVNLAPLQRADELLPAVESALGVKSSPTISCEENLRKSLQNKELLLILDNFEQILPAGPLLLPLLGHLPGLKMLITSREALRIPGEHEVLLAPLPVPAEDDLMMEQTGEYPAVQLFLDRARAIDPSFGKDHQNLPAVIHICRRLDGLPLAIELAAARVHSLSLAAMLEQLDRRYEWLTRGRRDLPLRRQTLWGAVEWSYNLLSEEERVLFCNLSVFAGEWDLAAAEAVFSLPDGAETISCFDLLLRLVDKSLIVAHPNQKCYSFLETLRQFACEKLKQSDRLENVQQLHCEYYLRFVRNARPHLLSGGNQVFWFEQMAREHNNLRAALNWAINSPGHAGLAMQLGYAIHPFWFGRSYISEAHEWMSKILALDVTPSELRANLLRFASDYAAALGDYPQAQLLESEAMEISRALGDEAGVYYSMDGMAALAGMQGDYVQASNLLEQVLLYRRRTDDSLKLTATLNNLALATRRIGNLERARTLYEESAAVAEAVGNLMSLSHALNGLAEVYKMLQDYTAASALLRKTIGLRFQLGNMKGLISSLTNLAELVSQLGNVDFAIILKSASIKIQLDLGLSATPATKSEDDAFIFHLCQQLGDERFNELWEQGQKDSLEQIVQLVLKEA